MYVFYFNIQRFLQVSKNFFLGRFGQFREKFLSGILGGQIIFGPDQNAWLQKVAKIEPVGQS